MWTHLRASADTRDTLSPRISPKGANERKVLVDHPGSRSNAEDGINWCAFCAGTGIVTASLETAIALDDALTRVVRIEEEEDEGAEEKEKKKEEEEENDNDDDDDDDDNREEDRVGREDKRTTRDLTYTEILPRDDDHDDDDDDDVDIDDIDDDTLARKMLQKRVSTTYQKYEKRRKAAEAEAAAAIAAEATHCKHTPPIWHGTTITTTNDDDNYDNNNKNNNNNNNDSRRREYAGKRGGRRGGGTKAEVARRVPGSPVCLNRDSPEAHLAVLPLPRLWHHLRDMPPFHSRRRYYQRLAKRSFGPNYHSIGHGEGWDEEEEVGKQVGSQPTNQPTNQSVSQSVS
ncbi:hypothetical protein M0804_002290 [Polistes exclamans]|nr:hypothetical protein M0804_002290 [Polistes exclamans]